MSRKLDALVAEKVMGWDRSDIWRDSLPTLSRDTWEKQENKLLPWYDEDTECVCSLEFEYQLPPRYSTDIAATWEVVDCLVCFCDIAIRPSKKDCLVVVGSDNDTFPVEADTAPLAICLAALKSVGVAQELIDEALKED